MNNNDHRFDTGVGQQASPFEMPELDRLPVDRPRSKIEKGISVVLRIVAFILIVSLLLYFLYSFLLHPIDKLKLKMLFAYSYTIRIRQSRFNMYGIYETVSDSVTVYFDGIYLDDGSYYKTQEDGLYRYNENNGEWIRTQSLDSDDGFIDGFDALLDKKNYEFNWNHLFTWKLYSQKGDTGMILKHRFGKFTYELSNNSEIVFEDFKYSYTPRPWDGKN